MPFRADRYPDNWKTEIRPRILAREENCCKFCSIADRLEGWRFPSGRFYTADQIAGDQLSEQDEAALEKVLQKPPMRIILTVAHLDHGLSNHQDENLAALCQRCHLNFDRPYCQDQRKASILYGRRKGQFSLF